jgi:predicted ribosomally synthesized peptide with SipW-like signal peptide
LRLGASAIRPPRVVRGRRPWGRADSRSVRLWLSLGVVVAVVVPGTFAYFTDTVPVTTAITAAKVDLKVNGSDNLAAYSG